MTVERVTSKDGTSIAYERVGNGPAVILVDAAATFRGFGPMVPLADALAPDLTVFRYDRRGRGDSTDTLPYAVDREIEDLQAIIEVAGGSAFGYGFSSGAVLALRAAASGLAIPRLALLEPPVAAGDEPEPEQDLGAELTTLVEAGRRRDALELFYSSIGVPADMTAGMQQDPAWPKLEALAHTLVYDLTITGSTSLATLPAITTPTLVIDSTGSDDSLRRWARGAADTLPNARHRSLTGQWHGVPIDDLASTLVEFFTNQPERERR